MVRSPRPSSTPHHPPELNTDSLLVLMDNSLIASLCPLVDCPLVAQYWVGTLRVKCTYVNYILLVCTPGAGEGRTDAGVHRRGWRGCGVRTMCDARAPLMRRWLPSGLLRPLVAALAISGRAGAQFDNDAGDISVHTTHATWSTRPSAWSARRPSTGSGKRAASGYMISYLRTRPTATTSMSPCWHRPSA